MCISLAVYNMGVLSYFCSYIFYNSKGSQSVLLIDIAIMKI